MADPRQTPAMQQYYRFKQRHPDCVLLFRIGDFYEMFDDDAVRVSQAIGLTLTQRTAGVPMAGMPFHQLDNYLRKLTQRGFRVAICEQLVDASQAKGLVPRAVTRVITPGTLVDETLLESDASVSVGAVVLRQKGSGSGPGAVGAALAIAEVSTGSFVVVDCELDAWADELARQGVREVLFADMGQGSPAPELAEVLAGKMRALRIGALARPAWHFRPAEALEVLKRQFGVSTLAGFGLSDSEASVQAAGALLRYLEETQTTSDDDMRDVAPARSADSGGALAISRGTLKHMRPPRRLLRSTRVVIDAVSVRSLELERTMRDVATSPALDGGLAGDGTLLGVFACAGAGKGSPRTPMGRRLLREWLCAPSRDLEEIARRQRGVALLREQRDLAQRLGEVLAGVQDIARIAGRVALARATPRDVVALARSVGAAGQIVQLLQGAPALAALHAGLAQQSGALEHLASQTLAWCVEEPPAHLREGGLIREGVDKALDEARLLERDAGAWLAQYQSQLISEHNLPSLRVGYNKVAGYFIELPTAQAATAPPQLKRMQTLRNAERFTTPQLSEFERNVTTAQARALERERELFQHLCEAAVARVDAIAALSESLATVDVLLAFGDKASSRNWTQPELAAEPVLAIEQGRHPVLDELLASATCVPNDCELGSARSGDGRAAARLALITGPNMAGKSTYIRMVALLAILAHTGSFVPAAQARVGLMDRVFTRIGADDALHAGQSTFMVEMVETASILHHATQHSLVVLDEVGRGTSTLDGLSLAWAIVEHLAGAATGAPTTSAPPACPRTLFATHYHELTDLEERLPGRVQNLHVAVREWPVGGSGEAHSEIVFLHRILPGRTDQSYGVHVARLAGMPASVVSRAREVLGSLAVHHAPRPDDPNFGVSDSGVAGTSGRTQDAAEITPNAARPAGDHARASDRRPGKRRLDITRVPPTSLADPSGQLALFREFVPHPAIDALREVKLDVLTPLQAFDVLRTLRALVVDESGVPGSPRTH